MLCAILPLLPPAASAASLSVTLLDRGGQPVAAAGIVLEGGSSQAGPPVRRTAVMDQRQLQFVPELLVIQTGTDVSFPNSDQVLHQVYSFSGAKKFSLSLYAGKAHPPVNFDRPGLVTLGCNIHDNMIGYIWVSDSPWMAVTDSSGRATIDNLPAGSFTIRAWHPGLGTMASAELRRGITLAENDQASLRLQSASSQRATTHSHGTDRRWDDY